MSILEATYNIINTLNEKQLHQVFNFASFIKSNGLDIPNDDTLEAIQEVQEMKKNPDKYKGYTDIKEMFKEILE